MGMSEAQNECTKAIFTSEKQVNFTAGPFFRNWKKELAFDSVFAQNRAVTTIYDEQQPRVRRCRLPEKGIYAN